MSKTDHQTSYDTFKEFALPVLTTIQSKYGNDVLQMRDINKAEIFGQFKLLPLFPSLITVEQGVFFREAKRLCSLDRASAAFSSCFDLSQRNFMVNSAVKFEEFMISYAKGGIVSLTVQFPDTTNVYTYNPSTKEQNDLKGVSNILRSQTVNPDRDSSRENFYKLISRKISDYIRVLPQIVYRVMFYYGRCVPLEYVGGLEHHLKETLEEIHLPQLDTFIQENLITVSVLLLSPDLEHAVVVVMMKDAKDCVIFKFVSGVCFIEQRDYKNYVLSATNELQARPFNMGFELENDMKALENVAPKTPMFDLMKETISPYSVEPEMDYDFLREAVVTLKQDKPITQNFLRTLCAQADLFTQKNSKGLDTIARTLVMMSHMDYDHFRSYGQSQFIVDSRIAQDVSDMLKHFIDENEPKPQSL